MRAFAFVGVVLIVVLTGSIGSITDPELVDPRGDIAYQPYYVGPRDHPEADVEAAWMDYDSATDSIAIHLQVPSTLRFEDPSPLFQYRCDFDTNLTVDQQFVGRISAVWDSDPGDPEHDSNVSYYSTPPGAPSQVASAVPHTFELIAGEPGFYVWRIERAALQLRGAEATDFYTLCAFYHYTTSTPEGFISDGSLLGGVDHGVGHRSFVYGDLRPVSAEVREEDPTTTAATSSSSWVEEGATSALGVLAVAGVLAAVAFGRRKR